MLAAASWWYLNVAPHIGPTTHNDFLWGLLHGFMIIPNFIYCLFNNHVTIYQAPNTGAGYNFGFLIGSLAVPGGIAGLLFD